MERDTPGELGRRIADALSSACHPRGGPGPSVEKMVLVGVLSSSGASAVPIDAGVTTGSQAATGVDARAAADQLVVALFNQQGRALVRLARLFVDDRNAAEDVVQEAFIRLARSAHRIQDQAKAPAYLRSIVLNLARDNNRRGLVSLRHHLPFDDLRASTEDVIELRDDQAEVIDALKQLPYRQRDCIVLRYYEELGIDDIATTLAISPNSVKTHLKRGLVAMEKLIGAAHEEPELGVIDA
jgi:RNA polymerase sigma factor (sigma-70 family)